MKFKTTVKPFDVILLAMVAVIILALYLYQPPGFKQIPDPRGWVSPLAGT